MNGRRNGCSRASASPRAPSSSDLWSQPYTLNHINMHIYFIDMFYLSTYIYMCRYMLIYTYIDFLSISINELINAYIDACMYASMYACVRTLALASRTLRASGLNPKLLTL